MGFQNYYLFENISSEILQESVEKALMLFKQNDPSNHQKIQHEISIDDDKNLDLWRNRIYANLTKTDNPKMQEFFNLVRNEINTRMEGASLDKIKKVSREHSKTHGKVMPSGEENRKTSGIRRNQFGKVY